MRALLPLIAWQFTRFLQTIDVSAAWRPNVKVKMTLPCRFHRSALECDGE
jgi:hypothetical protein